MLFFDVDVQSNFSLLSLVLELVVVVPKYVALQPHARQTPLLEMIAAPSITFSASLLATVTVRKKKKMNGKQISK